MRAYLRPALVVGVVSTICLVALVTTSATANSRLRLGKSTYALEVADTPELRQKGLGGRASLAADQGMVFVFDAPGRECFWMKDMQFSIDIIWINEQKKVVHMAPDVSPETYPKLFCPPKAAKYVVELPAGEARRSEVAIGDALDLQVADGSEAVGVPAAENVGL